MKSLENIPVTTTGINGVRTIGFGHIADYGEGHGYLLRLSGRDDDLFKMMLQVADFAPCVRIEIVFHLEKATPEGNADGTQQR